MRVRDAINLHKGLVIPVVLGLMWYFDNYSTEAFVYLSLHGSYSILWLIKDGTYPDRRFDEQLPLIWGILFVFIPLSGYYIAPYILISNHITASLPVIALSISLVIFGVFLQ